MKVGGHQASSASMAAMLTALYFHALKPEDRLITVIDGHPATLSWLGGVSGHRTVPLGVEHFGQTGTIADLYKHFMIDADSIVAAASRIVPGKPIRLLA